MSKKAMPAAPGQTTTGSGKTSVRTTMKPVFGRGAGKKAPRRGGRR